MNKMLIALASTLSVAVSGLGLALAPGPAQAHHCKGAHAGDLGCGGGGGSDSGKVTVNAVFDNANGDGLQSDGNGSYPGEIDFARFKLPLGDLGRNLTLDFRTCLNDAAECAPPFDSGEPEAALAWLAVRGSKDEDLLEDLMLADVELRIRFEQGGTEWHLDFNPTIAICAGGAGYITMTRVDADTWTFGGNDSVACLQENAPTGNGNRTQLEFRGNYSMPFLVTATRQ